MNPPSNAQLSDFILEHININLDKKFTFFQIYKNAKGTRFTKVGYEIAKSIWTSYPLKLKENYRILNRTLLLLDTRMNWPYYLSKTQLVLFNEMDAFEFTLYQGDINLWSNKFEYQSK